MAVKDMRVALKKLIEAKKKEAFVAGYKATDDEALGIMLSQYFEWAGEPIARTAHYALEDANFHTLDAKFCDLCEADGLKL